MNSKKEDVKSTNISSRPDEEDLEANNMNREKQLQELKIRRTVIIDDSSERTKGIQGKQLICFYLFSIFMLSLLFYYMAEIGARVYAGNKAV
eukprot:snap_masked-scaffold_35-processed-gene-0.20-mRNA-1 protein AED:1.00 eAED:1.00 QI:0/-1/0/0/-1/1/1/0/91